MINFYFCIGNTVIEYIPGYLKELKDKMVASGMKVTKSKKKDLEIAHFPYKKHMASLEKEMRYIAFKFSSTDVFAMYNNKVYIREYTQGDKIKIVIALKLNNLTGFERESTRFISGNGIIKPWKIYNMIEMISNGASEPLIIPNNTAYGMVVWVNYANRGSLVFETEFNGAERQ